MPPRMHEHELDIDDSLARSLLADQLPEHAALPLARVASGGTENAVFRVGADLALRMPLHADAVGALVKETRWLSVVAPQLPLEVPEIVYAGEPTARYPFPWALVRWLDGADALTAPIESLSQAARALGNLVAHLQALDASDAPATGTQGFSRGGPLAERDEDFRWALPQCDGLIDIDHARAVWDDGLNAPAWDGPPSWLHADLIPGNILVRAGRVVGVLDFGALSTGDPAYDITPAWHLLDAATRPLFRSLVRCDDATWRRARALVVSLGVMALPYYLHTNPAMVATARRGIGEAMSHRSG